MGPRPTARAYWWRPPTVGSSTSAPAKFFAHQRSIKLNQPVWAIAATPDGAGYWMSAHRRRDLNFGDAQVLRIPPGRSSLNKPIGGSRPRANLRQHRPGSTRVRSELHKDDYCTSFRNLEGRNEAMAQRSGRQCPQRGHPSQLPLAIGSDHTHTHTAHTMGFVRWRTGWSPGIGVPEGEDSRRRRPRSK